MATAEFAAAIPALILVLVLALSAIVSVTDQVRCVDAARATARALARGDEEGAALAVGRRLAPPRATFAVLRSDRDVSVVVRGAPAAGLRWLGSRATPTGHAVAAREDVVGGPVGLGQRREPAPRRAGARRAEAASTAGRESCESDECAAAPPR